MKYPNVKKTEAISFRRGISFVAVFGLLLSLVAHPGSSEAAQLTNARDYLNRQQASVTTGIQHEVFLKPATSVSGGAGTNKVILVFPDGDDGLWCRTAGTLTVTPITNPTGATETSGTLLPGTPTGACTQGSGGSSFDTFTISAVDNMSAGTNYGVRFVGNTAVLGTAAAANDIKVIVKTNNGTSDIDTQTIALSLIASDQVSVTATIDPTLTVVLNTTTAALGTLSTSQVSQAAVTSTVTTNAAAGYVSLVKYSGTMTNGVQTLADTAGGTIVAGTSEFGVSTSASSQTISTWSPTACATTGTTSTASALTTTFQSFGSSASAVSADVTTLCFLASTTALQAPGSYTATATMVTTAKF